MRRGITTKEILDVFATFPKGKIFPVEMLLDNVRFSVELLPYDMEVHTKSRPTSYPRWKGRVQGVLYALKKNNRVIHDPVCHTYMFV